MASPGLPAPYGYGCAAQFTMYAYDWLLSISEEIELVSKAGMTFSIAIYFMSRIAEFSHVLILIVVISAQVENCEALVVVFGTCAVLSVASTSFLFLLRVRAVYLQSKPITATFFVLWLTTVALHVLWTANFSAEHLPSTHYCIANNRGQYAIIPSTATFVYDTMVFLAISYRLAADAATRSKSSWSSRLLSALKGRGLRRLSKALLQSGMQYYIAMILFFFTNLAVIESPLITNPLNHYTIGNAYIAFTNIMACRIFRNVALEMAHMEGSPTGLSSTRVASALRSNSRFVVEIYKLEDLRDGPS